MSNCRYCQKPAGFLRKQHKECHKKFQEGICLLNTKFNNQVTNGFNKTNLDSLLHSLETTNFITKENLQPLIVSAWKNSVDNTFDDNILSLNEETNLIELKNHFNLTETILNNDNHHTKLVQGATLRDLTEGKIPNRIGNKKQIQSTLPFNFTKKEELIWYFNNVDYLETKLKTRYEGRSSGVSIRVAKGIYFRTSAFKGNPVSYQETNHIDTGTLAITNQNIYFDSNNKTFKIKFDKIIAFKPYSDGVEIQKDGSTSKPQTFVTGDGWFIYNLLTQIAVLE